MRSSECCELWAHDCADFYDHNELERIDDIKYHANNVHAIANKLYSYSTPICMFKDGEFIFSVKKYSMTTSKHQSYMRGAVIGEAGKYGLVARSVNDINNMRSEDYVR